MKPGWVVIKGRAEHVRSHQLDADPALLQQLSQPDRHRLLGNKLADEKADDGQAYHQAFDKELLVLDQLAFRTAQAVVALAAKILALHPTRPRHQRRPPLDDRFQLPLSDAEDHVAADAHQDDQRQRQGSDVGGSVFVSPGGQGVGSTAGMP